MFCLGKRYMETGSKWMKIWNKWVKDMKQREQKEHSKQGDKQNKFILITKYALIQKYC